MLRIRLQRTGNKNNPTYRLVVADKARPVKKKSIEILGHYLPTRNPAEFEFKQDRVEHWISNGAAPTDTVARLLTNSGMKGLEKFMEKYTKKKKRNAPEEEEAPAAAPAETTEAPAEDAPAAQEAPAEEAKEEEKPAEEEKKEEEPVEEAAPEASEEEEKGDSEEKES